METSLFQVASRNSDTNWIVWLGWTGWPASLGFVLRRPFHGLAQLAALLGPDLNWRREVEVGHGRRANCLLGLVLDSFDGPGSGHSFLAR